MRLCTLRIIRRHFVTFFVICLFIVFLSVCLFHMEIYLLKNGMNSSPVEDHFQNRRKIPQNNPHERVFNRSQIHKSDFFGVEASVRKYEENIVKSPDTHINHEMKNIVMKDRRRTKEDVCHKAGLDVMGNDTLHKVNPWEYFINHQYKLVWCNVFKSASTSWMYIFNILAGYSASFLEKTKAVPLQLARDKYRRPTIDSLLNILKDSDVTSLIIGRNPFERLVSAYREKIQGALPGTLHDKLRRRITQDFRGVTVPKKKRLPIVYIPTFQEFTQYLVRESQAGKVPEMHWAPVYSFCNPCQVHINTILKFETLDEDTQYVLEKIGAPDLLKKVKRKNQTKGKHSHNVATDYLKQLDQELYEKLIDIYKIDFEIFGYKIPAYNSTSML